MSRRRKSSPVVPPPRPAGWWREISFWGKDNNVKITNRGHNSHYVFRAPFVVADWWPETGRLVFNKKDRQAIVEFDHLKVMAAIERRLPRVKQQSPAQRPATDRPCFLDFPEHFRLADLGYLDALIIGVA